jgi:hypothetical protein
MNNLISPQARTLMSEGRMHHYRFKVVGHGDLPQEGYSNEWWTAILKSQESIPPEARPAIEIVRKTGVPIKGVYIRHEAPRLLPAPKVAPKPIHIPQTRELPVKRFLGLYMGFLTIFALSILIDPVVCVVTQDGTHVEVAKWFDYIFQ